MKSKKKMNWLGKDEISKDKGKSFQFLLGKTKKLSKPKPASLFSLNTPQKKISKTGLTGFYNSYPKRKKEVVSFMKPIKVDTIFNRYTGKKPNIMTSEQLLYGKTSLKKFGDKDMDGSPNRWDCSPGKVHKDSVVSWLKEKTGLSKPSKGWKKEYSESSVVSEPVQYAKHKQMIELEKKRESKRLKEEYKSYFPKETSMPKKKLEKYRESLIQKRLKETGKKKLSDDELLDIKDKVQARQEKYLPKGVEKSLEEAQKLQDKILEAEEKLGEIKQYKEGGAYYGKLGKIRRTEDVLAEKIWKGEKPSTAELEKLYQAREKYKQTNVVAALKAGELPSAKAVKTLVKGAEWGSEVSSFGRRTSAMAAGVLGAFLPQGTLSGRPPKTSSFTGGAGRPKGSYKYYIPGKGAVDVYTWRKWDRQQRAIQRLQGQGQLPEQSEEYKMEQQLQRQAQQLDPNRTGLNDQGNYDYSKYQAPEVYDTGNLPPEQAREVKSMEQNYQRAMLNKRYDQTMGRLQQVEAHLHQPARPALAVKAVEPQFKDARQVAQYNAQARDNVLNAPIIQRGDMVGTGHHAFTYTPPEANILNAPNITMGQMRNVENAGREIPAVRLSEKPIPNPDGDQYTEIDPVSGKVVLKRRISEKWVTGEAY